MRYSTQIKPISYLKANAAEVLDELSQLRKPLIITQNGEEKLSFRTWPVMRRLRRRWRF
jgi:hypothetical protein